MLLSEACIRSYLYCTLLKLTVRCGRVLERSDYWILALWVNESTVSVRSADITAVEDRDDEIHQN